jgi:hypothetical protein
MEQTRLIEALAGPYSGQRLTLPAADAEAAISAGWARDPFAPAANVPANDPAAVLVAAEKAARKLRGETNGNGDKPDDEGDGEDGDGDDAEQPPPAPATGEGARAMAAERPGSYTTRAAAKPAPGRPKRK